MVRRCMGDDGVDSGYPRQLVHNVGKGNFWEVNSSSGCHNHHQNANFSKNFFQKPKIFGNFSKKSSNFLKFFSKKFQEFSKKSNFPKISTQNNKKEGLFDPLVSSTHTMRACNPSEFPCRRPLRQSLRPNQPLRAVSGEQKPSEWKSQPHHLRQ